MGGTDDPSNLIELSIEEHAEAHRNLYEKHGHWQDRIAYEALSKRIGKEEILREKQGAPHRGKKKTQEQIDKIKKSCEERTQRWKSDPERWAEINKKRSEAMKGRKKSVEAIENWKKSRMKNEEWHSEETKKKISNSLLGNNNRVKNS